MRKCSKSWIDSYVDYTRDQESPTAFHHWVALSLISAAIGRNIWIPRVKYTTYPNLYVVLVAGSAKCRKSVSISIGRDILNGLKEPPTVFAQKITTEALIEALELTKKNDACFGLICASELSVFLGSDAIKSGIIPTLTDLYDSPKEWVYHTKGRGKETLKNVTLSMLGASTKDWLRTSIPVEAIGGGFTSRVIFVFEDAPSKLVLFAEDQKHDEQLKQTLIHDLEIMRKVYGAIEFTPEARELSWAWYEDESCTIHEEKVDGYFGRKHDTMFKVATILSLSESNNLLIEKRHIEGALNLLERNEKHLNTVMESVTSTSLGGNADKVFQIVKKFRKIKHSDLLQKCWRYAVATDFQEIIRTLLESKEIVEFVDKQNQRWYMRKEEANEKSTLV